MVESTYIPFAARYGQQNRQIDNAFPETARVGLMHLVFDLIDRRYVEDWPTIAKELLSIGRRPPRTFNSNKVSSIEQAQLVSLEIINELDWLKVYGFCERLYRHLAKEVSEDGQWAYEVIVPLSDVKKYIEQELGRLFHEESLAYEFSDGLVRRRGRKHTVDATAKAHLVLGDAKMFGARKHYEKALGFFRSPSSPDYENSVKEAVSAVEAAAKELFPQAKASTLGDFAKWLGRQTTVEVPPALIQTIVGIYAFRNSAEGVSHGGATGGKVTKEAAEYVLSVCASQIIYLVDLAYDSHEVIPF